VKDLALQSTAMQEKESFGPRSKSKTSLSRLIINFSLTFIAVVRNISFLVSNNQDEDNRHQNKQFYKIIDDYC
jgi:hypothetical protein